MSDSFVEFTSIRNPSKMLDVGNENAILKLAIIGMGAAKTIVTTDQGQLKNSTQYITGTGKKAGLNDSSGKKASETINETLKRNEAAIGATAEHAVYIEYGTRKMPPQPFLRPSMAKVAGDSDSVIKKAIDAEIKQWESTYGKKKVKL